MLLLGLLGLALFGAIIFAGAYLIETKSPSSNYNRTKREEQMLREHRRQTELLKRINGD